MPQSASRSSADTAIRTTGLTKRSGPTVALHGPDLSIGTGEVYGSLDPNGRWPPIAAMAGSLIRWDPVAELG